MFLPNRHILVPFLLAGLPCCNAAVVMPGSNNVAIEQLTLLIGGSDVVQNTEATGVIATGNAAVNVKSVRITDGGPVNLTFFNTEGAKAVNVNAEFGSISGVGVFDHGTFIPSTAGAQAYGDAYAAASQNSDLRNYGYHDVLSSTPTPGTPDLDLLFFRALNLDDYVLVAERWGNSHFEVTALDANGQPYAGANVLQIGGTTSATAEGYTHHDWNTGYAAASNVPVQAQALTLFSVREFFEGTQSLEMPVYGLRINNDGEADVKLMGISSNAFSDNPINPQLVPEPSGFLMALAGGLFFAASRKRERGSAR